jgi:hypothetical protein
MSGWTGSGFPVDVLVADDSEVKLKGTTVTWAQVSPNQMLKFVQHCVRSRALSKSQRSEVFLNVAVYGERRVEIAVQTFNHKYPRYTTTFVVLQESREFGFEVIEWES